MGRKYDLVIFGATGFTGKCTVETLAKLMKEKKIENISWAVAGRSMSKLDQVIKRARENTGYDLSNVGKIQADIESEESLKAMARECKVVADCVGPFRFFGEPVVKACVSEGASYVDVCGEPQYLEQMQVKYHEEAKKQGVYIVGSCGFDSIPADCGVTYLQEKFEGDVNSVEMYLEIKNHGSKPTKGHYGTWQSLIYGLAHASELREIRDHVFAKPLPKPKYKLPGRSILHYNDIVNGWCLPFPGADRSVVKRSQYYFYHEEKKRPTQMTAYFKTPSLGVSLIIMIMAGILGVLAQFKIGRYLLEKFPTIFTLGFFTQGDIAKDEMDDVEFITQLIGEGWTEKLAEPSDQHSERPNKKIKVIIRGMNPGYGATCIMLLQSALTIIQEPDKLPPKGGVYTPGVAFAKSSIVDRLNATGVNFSVEQA